MQMNTGSIPTSVNHREVLIALFPKQCEINERYKNRVVVIICTVMVEWLGHRTLTDVDQDLRLDKF